MSTVQPFLSSQSVAAGVPLQSPPVHASSCVQPTPSLHGVERSVCAHPPGFAQTSLVQGLLSSQSVPVPAQVPERHASPVVQALPSSQTAVFATCTHPTPSAQLSSVQGLVSAQLAPLPTQAPPRHASLTLHTCPSSHAVPSAFVWLQPVAGSQVSTVHGLLSAQSGTPAPVHLAPEHVSTNVHALPSSHAAVVLAVVQPLAGSHPSLVHGFASSQSKLLTATHAPTLQKSPVVHALSSVHAPSTAVWVHPDAATHASSVHTFLSSQSTGAPAQVPLPQVSAVVQALASSHGTPLVGPCLHPELASQPSAEQGSPSSHAATCPGAHAPSRQASFSVQAEPSSHVTLLGR